MNSLEKLKQCFAEIGVSFIEVDEDEGYVILYTCSEEEEQNGRLDSRSGVFFEFLNGNLASQP